MIIVITNRKLENIPAGQTKTINVTSMGVNLGARSGQEDIIHTGLLSDNTHEIEFYSKGEEDNLFSTITQEELNKPWVFFVHGFHQDPEENMAKAKAVHDYHNVNIVNFAWPSRPLDETYDLSNARKDGLKGYLKGAHLGAAVAEVAYEYIKGHFKDFWKNYDPVIEIAKKSSVDLLAAMSLIKDKLNSSSVPVLLVHSMGNFLLQNTMENTASLPMKFNNIVLHQADVKSSSYEWVKKLKANLTDTAKLYITSNYEDLTLAGSSARRVLKGHKPYERLGQNQLNYFLDDINYLDFSCGPEINKDHEMFRRARDETNPAVFDCLGRVFRAEADLLPEADSQQKSGFTKMPTAILLYKLSEIIEPADIAPDPDDYISPLDGFTDPMRRAEDEDEDDD